MEYRKFGDTYVVRLLRGEEVIEKLTELCQKENIQLAEVSAIGAVDRAVLGVYDVKNRVFHKHELNGPMEISSLSGNVTQKEGQVYVHLHATVCDTELVAKGGHACELRISATCEMMVRVLSGHVDRFYDEEIGLNMFLFE